MPRTEGILSTEPKCQQRWWLLHEVISGKGKAALSQDTRWPILRHCLQHGVRRVTQWARRRSDTVISCSIWPSISCKSYPYLVLFHSPEHKSSTSNIPSCKLHPITLVLKCLGVSSDKHSRHYLDSLTGGTTNSVGLNNNSLHLITNNLQDFSTSDQYTQLTQELFIWWMDSYKRISFYFFFNWDQYCISIDLNWFHSYKIYHKTFPQGWSSQIRYQGWLSFWQT